MAAVILFKAGLYVYCRRSPSPAVAALREDHANDVATNLVGLAGALLGARLAGWIDPAAAVVLAGYIAQSWGRSAYKNAVSMVGQSAEPKVLQKLTWMTCNHDPRIEQVDTVRAYTFGKKLFVEVDIVLNGRMSLEEGHDIGEGLQDRIERLEEVERCFVHLDTEAHHAPEHRPGLAAPPSPLRV